MKLRVALVIVFLVSILIFLPLPSVHASKVPGVSKDTIKIGEIGDFTGPAASQIGDFIRGAQVYFRYLNEKGGGSTTGR